MRETGIDRRVEAIRRFNRFYTQRIGVLREGLLQTPFSLTEVRVMYELAHREEPTATELSKELGLDAGYLSRILRDLSKRELIKKRPSKSDGRQTHLHLTRKGEKEFAALNARSNDEVAAMLSKLPASEQQRVVAAIHVIEEVLGAKPEPKASYLLRPHQPGDMGWIVHRHGVLYAQEYGWDEQFEALVARIVAEFIQNFDSRRERCWIAEKDAEIVGSVFLVKESKTEAKLRLLLVEPRARGLGIGKRLVAECVRFARQASYKKITLWTNSVLDAARYIYEEAGFHLIKEEKHHSFGHDLVGQTWELEL
ncbi:MAG TPA: helix-turn-helix domain-containing GNAT family N-acetyltransferase [Blastocatellia bacterium]|nr:helix-turn-helix domain-containing GNAT family N-acetyltransferase [Blastocatellia bacterium]